MPMTLAAMAAVEPAQRAVIRFATRLNLDRHGGGSQFVVDAGGGTRVVRT
jgi:hypothetical protein